MIKNVIPPKVIPVTLSSSTGYQRWLYDDGAGDKFWVGGTNPQYYQWDVTFTVTQQNHSSHLTRDPNKYNGYDINVGDWVSDNNGIALKIISIISKTASQVQVIAEDVFRFNTFSSPGSLGNGFLTSNSCIVFELSEESLPIIFPLPVNYASANFAANIVTRFENINQQYRFELFRTGHPFVPGDVVAVDQTNHTFVKASADHKKVIGRVVDISSNPNLFTINPVQKIIDNMNYLPGQVGDSIYVDDFGNLTTVSSKNEIYIKLRDYSQSFTKGSLFGPTTTGNVFELNDTSITVTAPGTAASFVSDVNAVTSSTGVSASLVQAQNIVKTSLTLYYGEPALYTSPTPARATINGVTVIFNVDTVGQSLYGIPLAVEQDMATAINNAAIPNIVASFETNKLVLTNTTGGQIQIANTVPDASGIWFAGNNSGSGLIMLTPAATSSYIEMVAQDARAINLRNISGTTLEDFGLFSVENGTKAAALYVEHGLRDSVSTTVVSTIPDRNALSPMIGDQVMVLDSADNGNKVGEWSLWMWGGAAWIKISDEDSAATDARSAEVFFDYSETSPIDICTVSDKSRVVLITVEIIQAFAADAEITVGDDVNNSRLMNMNLIDLTSIGTYSTSIGHLYNTGSDVDIKAYLSPGTSSTGEAKITISYQ